VIRLHAKNQPSSLNGSASKVCVVVVGGGGGGWVESEFSDRLWLSFSLALAKRNNKKYLITKALKQPHLVRQPQTWWRDVCLAMHLWIRR
jgi:hypothetical protein